MRLMWIGLVVFLTPLVAGKNFAQTPDLGRLFFTPLERRQMDGLYQETSQVTEIQSERRILRFDGWVSAREPRIWISGPEVENARVSVLPDRQIQVEWREYRWILQVGQEVVVDSHGIPRVRTW